MNFWKIFKYIGLFLFIASRGHVPQNYSQLQWSSTNLNHIRFEGAPCTPLYFPQVSSNSPKPWIFSTCLYMRPIPFSRLYIASGGPRKKFTATVVINLFVSYSFWKTPWDPPIKSPSCKQFTPKMNFWLIFKYWAHSFLKHVVVTCHKIIHSYSGHQPIWIIFVLKEPFAPPYISSKFHLIWSPKPWIFSTCLYMRPIPYSRLYITSGGPR